MSFSITALSLIVSLIVIPVGYAVENGDQMKKGNILKEIEMANNWKLVNGVAIDELKVCSLPFLRKGKIIHRVSGWIYSIAISRNNDKVAFTVSPKAMASYEELYLIDIDGSNLVKLGEFDLGVMSFISDNKNLILGKYAVEDEFYRNRSVNLYKFNIASKEMKFLCSLKHINNHSGQIFSPDGQRLLYVDSEKNIMLYDIEKQKPTDTGIKGYSPAWSPDGNSIAYQGDDGNCYLMNPDGSGKELLWNTRGYKDKINLVWSPDSKYVLALRDEGGVIRLLNSLNTKSDKETVYYLIDRTSKIVQGLGALR